MASRHQLIAATVLATIALSGCKKSERESATSNGQSNGMSEHYTPPTMPPFPTDYDGVMKTLAPYYRDHRPLDYFFELYIVDVIHELPEATSLAIEEFSTKYPTFFEKYNGDWRKYVVEESHLSETIEIAIWDLWIRNSANAKREGWEYHPWHYAQNFAANYLAENSQVDVWKGDALDKAKQRIEAHRNNQR